MIKLKYLLFVLGACCVFLTGYFSCMFFNFNEDQNLDSKISNEVKEEIKEPVQEKPVEIAKVPEKIEQPKLEEKQKVEENKLIPKVEVKEKPKAKFGWGGYHFDSYDDFKKSPEYELFLEEARMRAVEREVRLQMEDQKQKDAAIYLKKYRYQNEVDRSRQEWIERGNRVLENK